MDINTLFDNHRKELSLVGKNYFRKCKDGKE